MAVKIITFVMVRNHKGEDNDSLSGLRDHQIELTHFYSDSTKAEN